MNTSVRKLAIHANGIQRIILYLKRNIEDYIVSKTEYRGLYCIIFRFRYNIILLKWNDRVQTFLNLLNATCFR